MLEQIGDRPIRVTFLDAEMEIMTPPPEHEPIYARLGVPEIWRFDGEQLMVRLLGADDKYHDSPTSRAFPFLPMDGFARFIQPMIDEDETRILKEFRAWLRTLPAR